MAIIHRGEIVALAAPETLLAGLGHEVLELRVGGDASLARAALGSHGVPVDTAFAVGSTLTVPLHDRSAGDVIAALQIVALLALAALRGAHFTITVSGVAWFVAAAALIIVFTYGVAETLASRIRKQEDYVASVPAVAILPFFFAGALFPIGAMPGALATIAKFLPLTHALALMRYALVDPRGTGLHAIWGMSNVTTEAWLSLGVVAVFAAALTAISIRVFSRSAVG